jgi:hypothetical protein
MTIRGTITSTTGVRITTHLANGKPVTLEKWNSPRETFIITYHPVSYTSLGGDVVGVVDDAE